MYTSFVVKKLFGSLFLASGLCLGMGELIKRRSTQPELSMAMPWAIVFLLPLTLLFFGLSIGWPKVKNKKKVLKIVGLFIAVLITIFIGLIVWVRYHFKNQGDNMGEYCGGPDSSLLCIDE